MYMNFVVINFVLLTLSTVLRWVYLVFERQLQQSIKNFRQSWVLQSGITLSMVTNLSICYFLINRWITAGYFPLSNLYESVLFLIWCLSTVQLISEVKTSSVFIGSILTPVQLALMGFSSFILPTEMQKPASLVPALQSNWLMLHVSMMMLSYAILILGSLLCLLIVFLSKKNNTVASEQILEIETDVTSTNIVTSLSSLTLSPKDNFLFNLDTWSYRTIGLGHISLTLGILAGAVWANESWGSYWSWDPKETWSLITWMIFTAYLHARLVNNWKGLKTALIGSIGFVSIWISYLGVNFLASGLHSYGWVK